jgi:hypothetical protein
MSASESEKHVVENSISGEVIAIFLNNELAEHWVKFLPFQTVIRPISHYDFGYDKIKEFMK